MSNGIFNKSKTYQVITSPIAENTFIGLADEPKTTIVDDKEVIKHNYQYLQNKHLKAIENYNNNKTTIKPTIEPVNYAINFVQAGEQPLLNGSKGPWDIVTDRIASQYQAEAHANGLKTLINAKVDMKDTRNLIIVSVILVIGIGGATIKYGFVEFTSMALSAIVGILLNKLLPKSKQQPELQEN